MRILKARFRSGRGFLDAFKEDLQAGGLFCPTTKALGENDPIVVELHFPELPNKMMLRGRVVWWRASLPRLRIRAGAMVAFHEEEQEKVQFIRDVAENHAVRQPIRRRHTRIPIELKVRWRLAESSVHSECLVRDLSVGGALLETHEALEVGDEVILEVITPGSAIPIPIAGRVAYRGPFGCGVRFMYRNGGGSHRLREVVRRIVGSDEAD
jgi:Tfp pilus assembly protein PilZ